MTVELAMLAVLTFAAIATRRFLDAAVRSRERSPAGEGVMKVNHYQAVSQQPVEMEGSCGCQVRWLLGEKDGTPNFAMRQFEVAPGGYTPRHSHPYEHEVFVLEGEGRRLSRASQPHPCERATWCWSSRTKSISFATRAHHR